MTLDHHERPATRFRPSSKDDFSVRAKSLAWLIEKPLQVTQNFLARIYGYEDLHALQKDLELAAAHPDMLPAGPYEEDIWLSFLAEEKEERDRAYEDGLPLNVARDNHLLQAVSDLKGVTLKTLRSRDWDIREIGLFKKPENHGFALRQIKEKHAELDGNVIGVVPKEVGSYASVQPTRGDDDDFLLEFTRSGGAVSRALDDLDEALEKRHDVEDFQVKAGKLIERHPNNPWVHARYVQTLSSSFWQHGWCINGSNYWEPAKEGYKTYAPGFARLLLPHALKAISLFEQLYGDKIDRLAPMKLMSWSANGSDSHHYPAILGTAGWIAATAGDLVLAKALLTRSMKVAPDGGWFTEDLLAVINLNLGSGPVKQLFAGEDGFGMWALPSKMARELRDEEYDEAAILLRDWLKEMPTVIRAIDSKYRAADGIRVATNVYSLASMQEFFHRSRDFWKRHPEAMDWLKRVISDVDLRREFAAYHAERDRVRMFVEPFVYPKFDEAFDAAVEAATHSPVPRY